MCRRHKMNTLVIGFGFYHTYWSTFNEKGIINLFIVTCEVFTDSDSKRRNRVELLTILDYPTSIFKFLVYNLSCLFFWCHTDKRFKS